MRATDLEKPKKETGNVEPAKKSPRKQAAGEVENNSTGVNAAPPLHRRSQSSAREILLPVGNTATAISEEESKMASSETLTEQFTGLDDGSNDAGEFQALNITKQRLDGERKRREEEERAAVEEEAAAAAAASAGGEEPGDGAGARLKSRLSSVRHLRWKSSSDLQSEGNNVSDTIDADLNAVEISVDQEDQYFPDRSGPGNMMKTVSSDSCGVGDAVSYTCKGHSEDATQKASQHLGQLAAEYLEKLCRELLHTDAPSLLQEIKSSSLCSLLDETSSTNKWVDTLMTIATRCCSTVEPDVKNSDFL